MPRGHILAMHIRRAYLTLHRAAQALFAPLGVTADQFVLLTLLAEEDGSIQQELVARSSSDPNTTRAILVLLEKQSLVARRPHASDGRARTVHLTAKGRSLQRRLMRRAQGFHEAISDAVPESHWEAVAAGLNRVAGAMIHTRRSSRSGTEAATRRSRR